jgi:hypothetical protein
LAAGVHQTGVDMVWSNVTGTIRSFGHSIGNAARRPVRLSLRAILIAALALIASAAVIDGNRHGWKIGGDNVWSTTTSATPPADF